MFRYSTSYRWYTLAKLGFGLAYLWYSFDFFRIHRATWDGLSPLMSPASDISFSGLPGCDEYIRSLAVFLSSQVMVWIFFLASPVAAGLFLWGRFRWLQFSVAGWMSLSMIASTALVGIFTSTADIWLNYLFVGYALVAAITPGKVWEDTAPGWSLAKWQANPAVTSVYVWLVVLIQFTVYFFAGVNKLVDGWVPWTTGVALQNLAFDSSMREFARGTAVPYWLSLALCYVTLIQRLVVPLGFYFQRYRVWSVIILGTMHLGYALLMCVNIFPLVGIASLLMVLPADTMLASHNLKPGRAKSKGQISPGVSGLLVQRIAVSAFAFWLILESARLTVFKPVPWENKLMIVPAWKMFADGGVTAGGTWRIILNTPHGDVDATDSVLRPLPRIWRDRFYIDTIFHEITGGNEVVDPLVDRLVQQAEQGYREEQTALNHDPTVLGSAFDIYRRDAKDRALEQ